jgi:hypothetical protein
MGMQVNVVVADAEDAAAIGESSRPIDEWRGFEARGLDQAKFAMLHALLSGKAFDEAFDDFAPGYAVSEEGPWLMRMPGESVERLAALEEDALERVADELAATEEFEIDAWPADQVQTLVSRLAELAAVAVANGEAIFVWMISTSSE